MAANELKLITPLLSIPLITNLHPTRRHMLLTTQYVAMLALTSSGNAWSAAGDKTTGGNQATANNTAVEGPDGLTDAELAETLDQLQRAVAAGDPNRVADLMSFPLQVNQGKRRSKWTKARFLASYGDLFDNSLRQVVAAQTPQALFRSSRGAMLGNGEVWLSVICQDKSCSRRQIKVIAMNKP